LLVTYIREAVRGGEGADGLLQRIQLFVWPDVSKEWHHVDRWPNTEAKNEAFAVFKYLDNLTADTVGADTSSGIPFLRFTGDAQEQFNLWRAQLERTIRGGTEHPAFEAHLSKYKKLVPALALIIHLADRDTGPVTLAALDKALLWAKYLESHARRIYSAVLRPDAAAARELAKHLQRGDLPGRFTLREAYYRGWAGLSDKEDAEAATEILCELGWIRPAAKVERTTGRPTGPVFESNPKIYGLLQNEPAKPQNNIALNGDQKITATPPERTRKTAKATSNGFAAPPVQEVAQSTIGGGLGAGKMSAEQAKELDITEADKQEAMAL
jgi:putative DNA primase/helicase